MDEGGRKGKKGEGVMEDKTGEGGKWIKFFWQYKNARDAY